MLLFNKSYRKTFQPGTPLEGFLHVSPIPIPPICNAACCGVCPDGPQGVVAGWGLTNGNVLPVNLLQISKDIMPQDTCQQLAGTIPIAISKFCTRVENGRDACKSQNNSQVLINS